MVALTLVRLWVAIALALGAATLTACPPAPPARPPLLPPPPPPAEPKPAPLPAPKLPSFRVIDTPLATLPTPVTYRLLGRYTLAAVVAPDGDTVLYLRGRNAEIRSLSKPGKVGLAKHHYVSARFSPDGGYVAMTDERRTVTIFAARTGRLLKRLRDASDPQWVSADTLGFRRGCQAHSFTVGSIPRTMGVAPGPCVDVIHIDPSYRTWFIAARGRYRRGALTTYTRLRRSELGGANSPLFAGTDDDHMLMPRVSPLGDRTCFTRADFDLYCRGADGNEELIFRNVRRPLRFDESGDRLLFAVGKPRSNDSKIIVADFVTRTLTSLPRAGRDWWLFLPGSDRIVGHGGSSSAIVYDLAAGWQADIGKRGEWEGAWIVPGDASRVILGRERGGSRDVFLATLPD